MNKYEWHDKVMTAGLGDAQTLAIAGYIFYRYNERTSDAFPSLATMAKDLGISVATAVRWVNKLEKAGYLTHKRGGTGKSNRYMLTLPGVIESGLVIEIAAHGPKDYSTEPDHKARITGIMDGVTDPTTAYEVALLERAFADDDPEWAAFLDWVLPRYEADAVQRTAA